MVKGNIFTQGFHEAVFGLGNYTHPHTRHSVGFVVLDAIAEHYGMRWTNERGIGRMAYGKVRLLAAPTKTKDLSEVEPKTIELHLLKPGLLMNVSGICVAKAAKALTIQPGDLMVIHDDLQRALGKVSLKSGGSSNGHNGIKSVTSALKTDAFRRIRVGIGRPPGESDSSARDEGMVSDHVLGKFMNADWEILRKDVFPQLLNGQLERLLANPNATLDKPKKVKIAKRLQMSTIDEAGNSSTDHGESSDTSGVNVVEPGPVK